ncbi:MAG: hypothetical protein Q8S73_09600 [Deltaproteobacteria bacterium]|nr:hypothetical protein [Myxococcales bacterium]MDP3214347.1 hypothetical protein [Deltaproteobacteria bacterium]
MITDALARLALTSWLLCVGCAQGNVPDGDKPAELDAAVVEAGIDAPELDVTTVVDVRRDVSPIDAPRDTGTFDAPRDVATLDTVTVDTVTLDTATVDQGPPDVPAVDLPLARDVGVDTGPPGPVACTQVTAAAVCGGRPCVDGYCCDSACDGACRSCARPGSEGRCTHHAAATDPESECPDQAPATCGTTGSCNGAGACARHPTGTPCNDGMACTSADTCDGAGMCRGAAPAVCAPGAGNECCLGGCDPIAGCRTTAGLCADRCDANHLRTARVCQGCGAAGAVGACGGGGDFTCDATTHALCRAVSCGSQTFHCTNDGGVWQWRTGTRCDDGNACTHSDACSAGACGGTPVVCASDPCATRACAGTATCAVTPHPGVACDDGNALTNRDVCSAAGACVGTVVCGLPADACGDGAQSRDRCTEARVIGRRTAASTAGFSTTANTCSASNRFDDCSWDAGGDHAYRLWARAGETLTVTLSRGSGCVSSSWDATLKLYQGGDCGTVTCSGDRWCRDRVGSGAQTYVAPRDGWIVLIVDGSTAFDDEGTYTLRVRLSGCAAAGCECP